MNNVALEANNMKMIFDGVVALNKVNIKIYKGEAMALVGENGAGKSTLIKCISGINKPNEGKIKMFGKKQNFSNVHEAITSGIGVVHQELKLCENMSIAENIFLGRWKKTRKIINYKKMYQESKKYLKMIGINLDPKLKVSELSIAKQQMVEIAKVLSLGAKIIILDEPTDTLSNIEANQLFKVLEKLKKKKIAILYVTHRMKEIKKICERYTILKDGLFIKSGFVKDISINKIIENMIGRKIEEQFPKQKFKKDKCVMEIKNLSSEILFNVNLKIYNGEILGIAGLVGSKRTEFAKTIVGLMNYNFGKIFYKNKILKKIKTKKMIENGIYYVTENRKKDGLFLNLDVSHNVIISNINKVLNKMKIISTKKIKNSTHLARKKLNIKFNNIDDKPLSLSGGNQQKLLLAKALFTNPQILILDEPTRGVDVGSRKEIYNIINDFATQGKAVVVISSELPEIIGISNRVAVFNNGYLRGILNKKEISEKEIMNLAILEN